VARRRQERQAQQAIEVGVGDRPVGVGADRPPVADGLERVEGHQAATWAASASPGTIGTPRSAGMMAA
jgi:hypothetical protein